MNIPFLHKNINGKIGKRIAELEKQIKEKTSTFRNGLKAGNFIDFERELNQLCTSLYAELAQLLISDVLHSKEMEKTAQILAQKKGLSKIKKTTVTVQLMTGHYIAIPSWYALRSKGKQKKGKRGPNGSGCHLILDYFGFTLKASPGYYSYITMLALLCPSFNCVVRVLEHQGIRCDYKRIRLLCYAIADKCFKDRVNIGLRPNESLAAKRVIISVDGGRTRTRQASRKDDKKYDTPWKEPKLFVIQVLNDDGTTSKTELPIYDCTMKKADACFSLLKEYLIKLNVQKAESIIFIADGAPWIWERAKPMLLAIGVPESKVSEAIDFYHAAERISSIVEGVKCLSVKKKKQKFHQLRTALKAGKLHFVIDELIMLTTGNQEQAKKIGYFSRNFQRLKFHLLEKRKLPLGSGIVESSIRRIINLRFKSPSTFWDVQNVEKLIFLRGIFLSGRWSIMIKNLVNPQKLMQLLDNEARFEY